MMKTLPGPPRKPEFEGYYSGEKAIKISVNGDTDSFGYQTGEMSNQKPIMYQSKKPINKSWRASASQYSQNPALHDNHLEMANLLCKQWKRVQDNSEKDVCYEVYREKEPNKSLAGFQPVNLDKFWNRQAPRNALGKPPS